MTAPGFCVHQPFAPRALSRGSVLADAGWRIKSYGIAWDGHPRLAHEEAGVEDLVWDTLPDPAETETRPGVGWVILHLGRDADYVVLGWWDRENELPVRVWVREGAEAWRPARGSESFCVWDLEVIAHERDAYVRHVLGPEGADLDAYLDDLAGAT